MLDCETISMPAVLAALDFSAVLWTLPVSICSTFPGVSQVEFYSVLLIISSGGGVPLHFKG